MTKRYSITETRAHLPGIVHEVELRAERPRFRDAYRTFLVSVDPSHLDAGPEFFERLRDRSPGRKVKL